MNKVYVLKDKKDEVKYVGITSSSLKTRLSKHYNDVKMMRTKNKHKISWFNNNHGEIVIEEIERYKSRDKAIEREIYWISKYREMGVNLINKTDGGEGFVGFKHDDETIKSISGENNHRYGKPNPIPKELFGINIEYSTNGVDWILFESIREASDKTGISNRFIKNMCDGDYVKKVDYMFRYEGSDFKEPRKAKIKDQSVRKKEVEVLIDDDWVLFSCAQDVSEKLGVLRTKVVCVCNGMRATTGGYKMRYKGCKYKGFIKKGGRPGKKIELIYNGVEYKFNSMKEAKNSLSISEGKLKKIIKNQ